MINNQANAPQTQPAGNAAPFQSASLYIGDLHPEVSEAALFELFNRVGPVASIRVCRDMVTRRSLGYAYVNFHNVSDAERALDTMNFSDIKGRPCRIMWSQRDPSLRKSGVGNVFVKNLANSVDNKGLFDLFSVFGNILSCKVATDENGNSKGYGYVHYETAESAQEAIQKLNGYSLEDKEVIVGTFLKRNDRSGQTKWTNLYVKQFPESWSDETFTKLFAQFGEVLSAKVARDETGKSKSFGFVDYASHEAASAALDNLNGKTLPVTEGDNEHTFELYVNRAQKKGERVREMKTKIDALKLEQVNKYQGMNLYVKNIDEGLTDDQLRETFSPYGTITSAQIMRDEAGNSKGFGFVCFSSQEEATRALNELNGRMINNKPLFVTLHQRKELRRAHLAATYNTRNQGMARGFPMGQAPMPYMYMQPGQPIPRQPFPIMPGQMLPRGPLPNYGGRGFPMPQYAGMQMQPQFNKRPMGGPQSQPRGRNVSSPRGPPMGGRGMIPGVQPGFQGGRGPVPNVKYTNQVRNQPQGGIPPSQGLPTHQQPLPPAPGAPLDHNTLALADPQTQKNMIGERLYPLILAQKPELAGKITGMLLEMDNGELLHLLESPDALASKIDEALQVLAAHSSH